VYGKRMSEKEKQKTKIEKMKTAKRIDRAWMIAAVILGFTATTHSAHADAILVSPGTGAGDDINNGGFESSTGTTANRSYAQIAPWFNFAGNNSTAASTDVNFKRTGTLGASVSTPTTGKASPGINTGHTIALGDTFDLTFWYRGHTGFTGTEGVTVTLYSTSGPIWSAIYFPVDSVWNEFIANNIAVAAPNIGEILFLRFVNNSGNNTNKFSGLDDVTLTVSSITTDVPFAGTINDGPSTVIRLSGGTYTGTSADNVLLGSATTTVSNILQAQTNPSTIDNASKVLRLGAAGGVAMTSGVASLTIGTAANNGTLTAGGADDTAGTVNLTNNDATALLTVNSVIANNGSGTVGVATAGAGTKTLTGTNTYSGATTINAGTLALGANNVLPDASNISLGAATLNAATFTDTVGTLDVTDTTAVINLGSGGALAFADSSAVSWTDVTGNLNITGTFVSGTSISFGTTSSGLTPAQLAVISVNGAGAGTYSLDASGYLVAGGLNPVLISPGTGSGDDIKNGGFESGSTGSYPNYTVVADWFNAGGGTGVVAAGNDRERTGAYGGSVALTQTGASHPSVATGHTIAAGDLFSLTFYHGYAEDWDVGTDTIDVFLYSTSGVIWSDTVTPSQNALTGNFDLFTANYIPVPLANIGETLSLRFESNASLNEYAAIDDVTLTVSDPPTDVPFAGTINDGPSTVIRLSGGTYTGTSADNVLLGSATTTVSNILQAQTNPTTIDNASKVLRLGAAGGVAMTSGVASLTIGTAANNGTLTAGGADNTAGTVNLTNNDATALLTVNSVIANNGSGTVGVATAGAGTKTLTGTNTYSGATTVSNGTLLVNSPGSLDAGSAVAVNGGTLGGSGTIGGTVTVATAGKLAPGDASAGTLSILGGLDISALAAGDIGKLSFELDALANPNDKLAVTGTLTIGVDALGFSDFVFSNLGGLEVTGGTPYKLITSGGITALDTLNPADLSGTLPGGLTGTLQIIGGDVELVVTSGGGSSYDTWATAKGLTGAPGSSTDPAKDADPDKDGTNNLSEFAFDGNPLSGANDGKVVAKVATVGVDQVLTLTLPVRTGANFTPDSGDQLSALIDGIYYRIEGGVDLSTFADGITEVSPAITAGLPEPLSTGWTYRTFRHSGTVPATPQAFLRAKISETP
jgi:fibronectin-binding autotransporter adhesin